MAKKRSSKSVKDKRGTSAPAKALPPPSEGAAHKATLKVPRGVRKQLRRLERQLADAARQERKRVRKLERAHYRRQLIQEALEELRGAAPAKPAADSVTPSAAASPAPVAAPPAVPKPASPRRASSRLTASPRRTAPKSAAKPAPKPAPRPAPKPAAPPDPDR
jgi:hypothetical protein